MPFTQNCLNCEVEFTRSQRRKYCSNKCSGAAKTQAGTEKAICPTCQEEFMTERWRIAKGRKYCSEKCWGKAHTGALNPNYKGGIGCNRGPNWIQQRRKALKRDKYACRICGRKRENGEHNIVSVHHIKPYREFNGDYLAANDLDNLITLCYEHHPKVEAGKKAFPLRLFNV